MTQICINILPFHFEKLLAHCTCLQLLWLPECERSLRPKHVEAVKTIVLLVEDKLMCIRQFYL